VDLLTDAATQAQRRVQVLFGSLAPTYTFVAYGAVLAAVAALTVLEVQDLTTVGAVTLLMVRSLTYGQQLVSVHGTVVSSLPAIDEVEDTLARYAAQPASGGTVRPASVTPVVVSRQLLYDGSTPTLAGVDFVLRQGEVLGCRPSGREIGARAGALGLRSPDAGEATVGGWISPRSAGWWTRRVSFVPGPSAVHRDHRGEHPVLRDDVDDAAVRQGRGDANVLAEITAMPAGFDTHLGERGGALSGGQQQHLSIASPRRFPRPARARRADPASSGHSEALIRSTIAALHCRVTVVVIAHRMSTIDMCDRIMVVEDGRVTASAPPKRSASSVHRRTRRPESCRARPPTIRRTPTGRPTHDVDERLPHEADAGSPLPCMSVRPVITEPSGAGSGRRAPTRSRGSAAAHRAGGPGGQYLSADVVATSASTSPCRSASSATPLGNANMMWSTFSQQSPRCPARTRCGAHGLGVVMTSCPSSAARAAPSSRASRCAGTSPRASRTSPRTQPCRRASR
jgi:ABC-type Na+ transport system ATPase subunit NatA